MARDRLSWMFELRDAFSGPAKNINRELRQMVGASSELGKKVSAQTDAISKPFKDAVPSILEFDAALDVGEKLAHVAEGIADIGYEMGKAAVEAASFKENTLVSLETVLGSAGKAKELFQSTVALADKLPVKTQEAVQIETRFALAGFKDTATLQRMLVAASDVKALRGEEGVQGFVRQMGDIAAVGLSDRHLMYLSQEAGIPENLIFDQLRKLSGRQGSDEQIKKLVSQGAFDRNTGETAVLQALAQLQGGQLGNLSGKLGQTVEGRLSTLASRRFDFLKDLDEGPGYASFRNFLGKLIDSTAPDSTFGTKLKGTIGGTFNEIFGRLFEGASIDATLDKLARGIADVGAGLQIAEAAGQGLFEGLFDGLNIAGDLFGPDGKLNPKKLNELQVSFKSFGTQVGQDLTEVATVLQEIASVVKYITDLLPTGAIGAALRISNDVANPLAMQGEVEGAIKGSYLDADHLQRSASRFWQGAPGMGGGGDSTTTAHVQVEQHFHMGDADKTDVGPLADRIKDDSASGMDAAMQQLALNRGAKW